MDPREWLFDKRVVRRNLDRGVLTMKAYKEYLKGVPDIKDAYQLVEVDTRAEESQPAPVEE